MTAVHGDYGHSGSSTEYKFKSQQPSNKKIALFGNSNDSHQLQKILERNGGNVPIGSGASRL